ncbi:MAG: GTPase [Lachnospiraceae bacterium]|nr:GTPase [Lachnospiraceae bacterium]
MDIPVYLFTGFMDSGKTTFIEQTLLENEFGVGARSLIIACEDGEVEYDEEKLAEHRVTVVGAGSEEEFTPEFLRDCDEAMKPDQVFIEYNGTWQGSTILEMELPRDWQIVQVLTTVDASTYELYLTNMRVMMMEQVFASDVVIFNRCTDETPKAKFRRTIKARNRKAQIIYEREDGTIDESDMEELPYDLDQDVIEITDEDYGIFYLDVQENAKNYEGKTIRFLALVYRPEKMEKRPVFIPGRFAMTCCVEDIQFIGLKCKYDRAYEIPHKSWVNLTAEIHVEFAKEYRAKGPVLYAKEVEKTIAPAEELVYFT